MLITRRGYQISKKKIKDEELKKINEDLYIIPKIMPPYNIDEEPLKLIHSTEKNIFIPRYYGIEKFGDIFDEKIFNSKKINCVFNGKLNDKQIDIMNNILPKIYKYHGGIISLPCGYGKTIIALYLISILKLKTIILVHKESLKEQWIQRIKEFINIENITIGIIQQNKIENNANIIIGMIPSIAEHNYDKIFNDIGLLIVDECHHIASKVFSKCLYKIGADYTIGLSATPTRKDGLTRIIHWYLGPQLIFINTRDKLINTIIYNIKYESDDNKFKVLTRKYRGKETINTVDMITNMTKISNRNILILNIIKKLLEDNERYIMVLSERVDHLTLLKTDIDNYIKNNNLNILTEYYRGSSTANERRNAENNDNIHILFGSYQIASEGLDIPRLNTLIMVSPKKDVEQCIGRIQRKKHNIIPLVIDIIDQINPFQNYLRIKEKLYKKNNYIYKSFIHKDIKDNKNKFNIELLNNDNMINIENENENNKECEENDNKIIIIKKNN